MDTMAEVGSSSAEETRLFIWNASTFEQIWPDVEPILLRDPSRWSKYYTLESLRTLPGDANCYVWTVHDAGGCIAVLYTQLSVWPVMVICRFLLMAAVPGKGIAAVKRHLEFIELWAHRSGAKEIEVIGREGWVKVLPPEYEFRAVHLAKDITGIKEH